MKLNYHFYTTIGNQLRLLLTVLFFCASQQLKAQQKDLTLTIHLLDTYKSKITLQSVAGASIKTVAENPGILKGGTAVLVIPKDQLPGEFVLRFDYQEKAASNPYPGERHIFIGKQNLEFWASPKSLINPDSSYFQKNELENTTFMQFSMNNMKRREQLGLLQNFLMNYDQPESKAFTLVSEEYENRRVAYNSWLKTDATTHKSAFVSSAFVLQSLPLMAWKGTKEQRMDYLMEHYFDGMEFKDPMIIKTTDIKEWMNKYVNLYGERATSIALRDSLFTLAGKRAIDHVKTGDPQVYGWMVDYFYNGFASYNITAGIKILQPYLDDPNCLTSKRMAIEQRLQGMESLTVGSVAPDFSWKMNSGKNVQFHDFKTEAKYKLVLFWSAECAHCMEMVRKLYPWYDEVANRDLMDVFAISVDESKSEKAAWAIEHLKLPAFKHELALKGIRSPEASAYFVLSTPTMVLVDSKTNKIVALPDDFDQLKAALK